MMLPQSASPWSVDCLRYVLEHLERALTRIAPFCLAEQRFRFSTQYPIEVPEVTFLTSQGFKAPEHPHIYS